MKVADPDRVVVYDMNLACRGLVHQNRYMRRHTDTCSAQILQDRASQAPCSDDSNDRSLELDLTRQTAVRHDHLSPVSRVLVERQRA